MSDDTATGDAQQPMLRVTEGDPTAEELATLVVLFAAASGGTDEDTAPAQSQWSAPTVMHRSPMPAPGPSSWVQLGRR